MRIPYNLYHHWDKLTRKILHTPFGLSREDWKKWHEKTKKEKPIRYWLVYDLDRFLQKYIINPLSDIEYWFKWRFVKKHQYNVIRLNLPPGYYDPDEQILHAIFDTVCSYVKNTNHDLQFGMDESDSNNTWAILNEIVNWWEVERPRALELHDTELMRIHYMKKGPDKDLARENYWKNEENLFKKEEEMICKMAKIRLALWY